MLFKTNKPDVLVLTTDQTANLKNLRDLRIVVPVQDEQQARLAVDVLKGNANSRLTAVRLFHCLEDKQAHWVNPMDVILAHDEQLEQMAKWQSKLRSLTHELADAMPNVRVSFNAVVDDSIAQAIAIEAEAFDASMILIVHNPSRKKHWLFPGISNRLLRTAACPVQIIKPAGDSAQNSMVFVA